MRVSLPQIHHDKAGFEVLTRLHQQAKDCFLDEIEIDMDAAGWFDADMCAAFGAILYGLSENANTVRLTNIPDEVASVLSKNGFLSSYGGEQIPDRWGTTIPYQRFDVKDDRFFAGYLEKELVERPELPTMSFGLLKRFRESIFEIFSNAVLHSKTQKGIFSCGQFFPKRDRLDFSVADLGIGICQNVNEHTGLDLSPEKAIIWATGGSNTTKRGQIPGGLGLKLLAEFIDLNGGRIQIVSDAGYWKRGKRAISTARLSQPFPGTVVSVEINTADKQSYALASEFSEADVF